MESSDFDKKGLDMSLINTHKCGRLGPLKITRTRKMPPKFGTIYLVQLSYQKN